jgi:pSer/pThr/pTyr-binding forkhead associated (FHA) protein
MSEEGMPRLIITTQNTTKEFTLDSDAYTLGRSATNDIVIDDLVVSRKHARLERTPDGYRITDAGSSNGLQYGTEMITEKILKDGDVLYIGESVSLTYSAPAKEPEPVPATPQEPVKELEPVTVMPPVQAKEPVPAPIPAPPPPPMAKPVQPAPVSQSKPLFSWQLVVLLIVLFIVALAAGYLIGHSVLSP